MPFKERDSMLHMHAPVGSLSGAAAAAWYRIEVHEPKNPGIKER
jgi:hypothetical protein